MIINSKKLMVRRSLYALMIVCFMMISSAPVFAETGHNDDVGVADVYEETLDSDNDVDVDFDADFDVGVDSDVNVDSDVDVDSDADFGDEDVSEGSGGDTGDEGGADFLFVELGVEVQFDGDAPKVVKLGLSGDLGTVTPVEVLVSNQGFAIWDVEALQAGAWVLSATADGYEPVRYRFVAGEMSQMLIRVSMGKLGGYADTNVESGWACSSVGSDAGPSMLFLFAVFAGSLWIKRRRKL